MVKDAEQRLQALVQPMTALRQRLDAAEQKLRVAQVEGALHSQADRVRAIEAALVAGMHELGSSVRRAGFMGLASFFTPSQKLRDVANGIWV